eukprot:gene22685-34728_t
MTVLSCKNHCLQKEQTTKYIALQDGNQCFCGSTKGDGLGPSDKCTKPCAGGKPEDPTFGGPLGKCGGSFANQVYEVIKLPDVTSDAVAAKDPVSKTTLYNPTSCGVAGATLVSALVVVSLSLGGHSFFTTFALTSVMPNATASVFIGTLVAEAFTVIITALLGHILPDSQVLSPYNNRIAAVVMCIGLGLVQVQRSFFVAGKDQEERRDEFRQILGQIAKPQKHDVDGQVVFDSLGDNPRAVFDAAVPVLLSEWGSQSQFGVLALSLVLDLSSVIYGGLLGQFYITSLACAASLNSSLAKNSMALKMHFVA